MNFHLDTACPKTIGELPLQGNLVAYQDPSLMFQSSIFYLGDVVYLRATLTPFAEIGFAEITHIMVAQYDAQGNELTDLNVAATDGFEINILDDADTPVEVLDVSFILSHEHLNR
eukprot:UN00880